MTEEEIMKNQHEFEANAKIYQAKIDQSMAYRRALDAYKDASLPSTNGLAKNISDAIEHNLNLWNQSENNPARYKIHAGLVKPDKRIQLKDYFLGWLIIASITAIFSIIGGVVWFLATSIHPLAGAAFVFLGISFLAYLGMD